jgi:hypothetical protein
MNKKSFDAVAWMRSRREQIDHEDQGLTWEEKRRKTLALLATDPLWQRLKSRVVEPGSGHTEAISETQKPV